MLYGNWFWCWILLKSDPNLHIRKQARTSAGKKNSAAIQRDFDILKRCALRSFMRFNKAVSSTWGTATACSVKCWGKSVLSLHFLLNSIEYARKEYSLILARDYYVWGKKKSVKIVLH